jgi:hypothetical protein
MNHKVMFNDYFNTNIKLFSGSIENSLVEFLYRNDSIIGWGEYKDAPFNIRISSIVVLALAHCPHEKSDWIINKILGVKKYLHEKKIQELKVQELGSLMDIFKLDKNSEDIKLLIRDELLNKVVQTMKDYSSLTTIITNLSALIKIDAFDNAMFQELLKNFLELQNQNGSWGKEENAKILLSNTSKGIIILSKVKKRGNQNYNEFINKGINYLTEFIKSKDIASIGDELGFYQMLILIKAVTIDEVVSNTVIDSSISYILKNINSDGGIGTLPQQPSNNEMTALLLYTFYHIGYFKYIPLRVAKSKVFELELENNKIQSELNVLKKQFDFTVKKEVNNIIDENKILNNKLHSAEKKIQDIKRQNQKDFELFKKSVEYDFLSRQRYYSNSSKKNYSRFQIMSSLTLVLLATFSIILFFINSNRFYLYFSAGFILLCFIYLLILYINQYRKGPEKLLKNFSISNNRLDSLSYYRHKFIDITSDIPQSAREELIYRLSREISRLPKDILPRYLEDLTMSLNLPVNKRRELYFWLEDIISKEEVEIQVVFEQIRRII